MTLPLYFDAKILHDHDGARYPSDHFPVIAIVCLDDKQPDQ